MFYKNALAIALLMHTLSAYATPDTQVTASPAQEETTQTRTYETPSLETLQADKEFCLKILSDEASDINALSPSGKTALQLVTLYFINNFTTEQLIAHALKRGADANVRDELERTPLFFVTAYALCPKVFEEKQNALDESLAQEAGEKSSSIVEAKKEVEGAETPTPKISRNPLHGRTLSLAVVELLLAFNADPTVTDKDGISPLLLAVSTGDQEVVELFARYGLMERIFHASTDDSSNIQECAITEVSDVEKGATA